MSERINLRSLDALRGLLATYVLAGHARWLLWTGWEAWHGQPHGSLSNALAFGSALLRYGHEAVMVFFVLSGFFIHLRAAGTLGRSEGANTGFDLQDFLRRRVRRLAPPYVFALVLTLDMDAMGRWFYPALYAGTTGDALLDQNFGRGGFDATAVGPALVMLPGGLGRSFGSNGPLWSLGYEVVYYLLYPLWLRLRQRGGAGLAYGVGALGLLVPLFGAPPWASFPAGVLAHYPIWLAGAALVEVAVRGRWPAWGRLGAVAVLGLAFAVVQRRGVSLATLLPAYLLGGTAVVLLFARMPTAVSGWRLSRGLEWLGLCSYTVYICHFPVLALLGAVTFRTFGTRPANGTFALMGAVAAVMFCGGCFFLCERPFLPSRRRAAPAPRTEPVSADAANR